MRNYDRNTAKNKMKAVYVHQPNEYAWFWWSATVENHYYSSNIPWFRKIRTTNERRQQIPIEDQIEYNVRTRGRRSLGCLPDSWHDITTSALHEEKCWKRNSKRKHQWKYE